MGKIFHWIYCLPLSTVAAAIVILVIVWAVISICVDRGGGEKWWILINRVLLVLYILIIVRMTIMGRKTGVVPTDWGLFGKIKAASVQKEYWREMLMNIFLFVPLGLMLPFAFKMPGSAPRAAAAGTVMDEQAAADSERGTKEAASSKGRAARTFKPWKRVLIFIITGFLISAVIEVIQLKLSIGHFEVEDVLCNTIGTAIGTGAFIIWVISRKARSRSLSR